MPYDLSIPGWMTKVELQAIERMATAIPENGKVVELGAFLGRSSIAWALSAPSSTIYCIDAWEDKGWFEIYERSPLSIVRPVGDLTQYNGSYEDTFRTLTKPYKNIVGLKGLTTGEWEINNVDLVFVDANHTKKAVLSDLEFWSKRLVSKGLLCGHDFCSDPRLQGVVYAVLDFAHDNGYSLFIPPKTNIWLMTKNLPQLRRWWYNQAPK